MAKSIVVVDDEKLVVYGLCSLLSENNSGFTVDATGSCGEEGLRLCIERKPDLLLTDIGMPGMDGLELIERVKQSIPEIKIVVLSCHDEYKLVHKAFLLGADDYILKKDIDKLNLLNLLEKLLPNDSPEEKTEQPAGSIHPLYNAPEFSSGAGGSMGIIGFKSNRNEDSQEQFWQPDIPMLKQLIYDNINPYGRYYLGLKKDLVIHFPELRSEDAAKLDHILKEAVQSASKYINHTVFTARYIINPGESLSDAYNSCLEILEGMFYHSRSAVLTIPPASHAPAARLSFDLTGVDLRNRWIKDLEEYLYDAERKRISPNAVKSELIFAIKHLLHHLHENSDPELDLSLPDSSSLYNQKILNFNDISLLSNWTGDFLTSVVEKFMEGRNRSRTVYKTKLYVNDHLSSDLRLSTVADSLSVNSNYLSSIFKKTTGQTFIEYVNLKRIKRACELLKTSDLSAKEIAFQCGYTNPNYFSRIFKKIMKTTVSEYRGPESCNL